MTACMPLKLYDKNVFTTFLMTLLQWGQTFIPLQHCSHVTLCPQFVNNIHRSFVLQITHNRLFFNSLLITLRLAGSETKGSNLAMNYFQVSCNMYRHTYRYTSGHRDRDRMACGFTTTYAISAYHHWSCEFEYRLCEEYSIQHYLIKSLSVTCDRSVVFFGVFRFTPPIKLTAII